MRDDPTALVIRARNGEKQAWDELVDRYAPLMWSICRRYRLGRADAEDVGQSVWMRLVGQLASLRDLAALPGWLATTTQQECGRVLRAAPNQEALRHSPEIPDAMTGRRNLSCSGPSATRRCARRSRACPLAPSSSSPCSSRTPRHRTPRSAPSWASRSEASDPAAAAAWKSCAEIRQSPP